MGSWCRQCKGDIVQDGTQGEQSRRGRRMRQFTVFAALRGGGMMDARVMVDHNKGRQPRRGKKTAAKATTGVCDGEETDRVA